jgi:hypothetical protein
MGAPRRGERAARVREVTMMTMTMMMMMMMMMMGAWLMALAETTRHYMVHPTREGMRRIG